MSDSGQVMGTHKVMVVDDDRTMVGLLRTLLELDGYQVAQPADHTNLLESIAAEHPDLVLMDVFLKGHDGRDLVKALRRDPELARIGVIMCSGMDLSEQCLAAGANAFVLKPYDPAVLLESIRRHLTKTGGSERVL